MLTEKELIQALFSARKDRLTHPDGKFDSAGRWYPSDDEECSCCSRVRSPSRRWPYSYLVHCRTRAHVAELVRQRGVDDPDLQAEAGHGDPMPPSKTPPARISVAYKKLALGPDGRLYSVYDGSPWLLGVERKETPRQNHNGGLYVYAELADAFRAPFPDSSILEDAPKVIVKCRVGGRYCRYDKKLAYERVTPLNVAEIV